MEPIYRSIILYLFLLFLIRVLGRRSLQQLTTFDFALLLVIGGIIKDALVDDDTSITNVVTVSGTLVLLNILFSLLKLQNKRFAAWLDGVPMILVENGRILEDRVKKSRLTEAEIMQCARDKQGLETIDQIKYAILEKNGMITIVPIDK